MAAFNGGREKSKYKAVKQHTQIEINMNLGIEIKLGNVESIEIYYSIFLWIFTWDFE